MGQYPRDNHEILQVDVQGVKLQERKKILPSMSIKRDPAIENNIIAEIQAKTIKSTNPKPKALAALQSAFEDSRTTYFARF